jgi:hypothetical protein
MSIEADELDALMAKVREEKIQHDPKGEFTDEEMAQIFSIAALPMNYWLELAKTEKEPTDDYGLRERLNSIRDLKPNELLGGDELLGKKE